MTTNSNDFIAVASDMDGTLLSPEHRVSDFTRKVIAYLEEKRKIPFVFATGRHHKDVLATKAKLLLNGYVVTSNGARVHDPQNRVIVKRDLPPNLAAELATFAVDDKEIVTNLYQGDHWYISRQAVDLTKYFEENKDVFFYEVTDMRRHPSFDEVYKVYYTCDDVTRLDTLEKAIKAKFGSSVSVAYSLPTCFEVMASGVDKGSTMALLLKKYLFSNDPRSGEELLLRCVTFGDGPNDYELLTMAGKGCVVANAQPNLVKRFTSENNRLEFVGSNSQESVAHKLMELYHITQADLDTV